MLPCIGSLTHRTLRPARRMASMIGGSASFTLPAPIRVMNKSFPGASFDWAHLERLLGRARDA